MKENCIYGIRVQSECENIDHKLLMQVLSWIEKAKSESNFC